jgi:hypothetical protein
MDWKQTIELSFKNRQRFVLRDSISEFELDELRAETGFDWPAEFVELYQCHNGIGLIDQAQNRVDWIFVPSSEMPSFC